MNWWLAGGSALLLMLFAWLLSRVKHQESRTKRELTLFSAGIAGLAGVLMLAGALRSVSADARVIPPDAEPLFKGVYYVEDISHTPQRLATHIVFVELAAPGVRFLVTPSEPVEGRHMPARTTSEFLAEFDLQVAINGDNFEPWEYNSPLDYYPHSGDPVDVRGLAGSRGAAYAGRKDEPTLYITQDNRARFNAPDGEIYNAISGKEMILEDGTIRAAITAETEDAPRHPRTVIAVDRQRRVLMLLVADGRQQGYSMGATLLDMAQIAQRYGAYDALNMDGGGSSALVIAGADGAPLQLNTPIHASQPGTERPIANHLGIYAEPLPEGQP